MIILFQNILFSNKFLADIGCFGLFTKIKKEFGIIKKVLKRRNNICLIPLLDAHSFSRWCTFLKMLQIPAKILINSNCLLQPIKIRKTWFLANKNLLLQIIVRTIFLWEKLSKLKVCFDYIIFMCTYQESAVRFYHFAWERSDNF